ncbi:hypothetical protein GCM10017782_30580 [Deinococcus ficus]|nr:hypothetical protein GCM10017782_30580 [Deinococcus ficus]
MQPGPSAHMHRSILLRRFQMFQMGGRPSRLIRTQKLGAMNPWPAPLGTRTCGGIEEEPSVASYTDKDADCVSVLEFCQADRVVPTVKHEQRRCGPGRQ